MRMSERTAKASTVYRMIETQLEDCPDSQVETMQGLCDYAALRNALARACEELAIVRQTVTKERRNEEQRRWEYFNHRKVAVGPIPQSETLTRALEWYREKLQDVLEYMGQIRALLDHLGQDETLFRYEFYTARYDRLNRKTQRPQTPPWVSVRWYTMQAWTKCGHIDRTMTIDELWEKLTRANFKYGVTLSSVGVFPHWYYSPAPGELVSGTVQACYSNAS